MFSTALIVFREVLEASLIVCIGCAATRGIAGRNRWIVAGLVLGLFGSGLVALGGREYFASGQRFGARDFQRVDFGGGRWHAGLAQYLDGVAWQRNGHHLAWRGRCGAYRQERAVGLADCD